MRRRREAPTRAPETNAEAARSEPKRAASGRDYASVSRPSKYGFTFGPHPEPTPPKPARVVGCPLRLTSEAATRRIFRSRRSPSEAVQVFVQQVPGRLLHVQPRVILAVPDRTVLELVVHGHLVHHEAGGVDGRRARPACSAVLARRLRCGGVVELRPRRHLLGGLALAGVAAVAREGRAARTLNARARDRGAETHPRRVGSARGAAYEEAPPRDARLPCRFAREEPDRGSEARRGKRDPANEPRTRTQAAVAPAARCVGRPDARPGGAAFRRACLVALVDVEKSRLFARHASWTFLAETGFHGRRPLKRQSGERTSSRFQTRAAPMERVLGRRPRRRVSPTPTRAPRPEAVRGTDEDVSMSGDPNATGPRARHAGSSRRSSR